MVTGAQNVISAAIHFKQLPPHEAIRGTLIKNFLSFDSLAGLPTKGRWVPVDFDESKHLFYTEVSSGAELLPWMEKAMVKPLANRENGPWWEIHALSTADKSDAVLFFRVDHACADGVALTQVLSKVATSLDGSPLPTSPYTKRPKTPTDFCAALCSALKAAVKYALAPFGAMDSDLPISS